MTNDHHIQYLTDAPNYHIAEAAEQIQDAMERHSHCRSDFEAQCYVNTIRFWQSRLAKLERKLVAAGACLAMAACGGGGTNDMPTAAPKTCTAPVVNIYGDSTNVGQYVAQDGSVVVSVNAPDRTLQRLFDAHFGPMKVKVNNYAVGGSIVSSLRGVPLQGISFTNFGINDSQTLMLEEFRAALRDVTPTFYETPNPVTATRFLGTPTLLDDYAQVVRDVGKERGIPVIDTWAYVKSIPNWQALIADTVHPGDELYRLIATNVLYPAIEPVVARQLCSAKD